MNFMKSGNSTMHVSRGMLLACVLFVSCDDFLENVSPDAALPLDGALESAAALETFLIGTYGLFASFDGDRLLLVSSDVCTQDIDPIPGGCEQTGQFDRNDLSPGNVFVEGMWQTAYEVINQTNLAIDGINDLISRDEISAEDADRLSGEAHFLRGVVYFELVRVFALPLHIDKESDAPKPGVPIVTQGVNSTDDITFPARDRVMAVYAQAESDLSIAMQRLPVSKGEEGRASYYAAVAYLAEIAFQNEEYDTVRTFTTQIIDAGEYDLVDPPEVYFRQKRTVEEIWSLVHTKQDGGSLYSATISLNCQSTILADDLCDRAHAKIVTQQQQTELEANGWTADDMRFSTLTFIDEAGAWRTSKYSSSNGGDNLPAMRYAEIVLMHAECLSRLGEKDEAITYLNMIRSRAIVVKDSMGNEVSDDVIRFSIDDFANPSDLIEAIIIERQVELLMEGNRFHDLIRLRRNVNEKSYDDDKLRWPIPQSELDANPFLMQNPEY